MVSLEGFKQMSVMIRLVWFFVFFFAHRVFFFKSVQRIDFRVGIAVALSERERRWWRHQRKETPDQELL